MVEKSSIACACARRLRRALILFPILLCVALTVSCSRPIVRPGAGLQQQGQGPGLRPYGAPPPLMESDAQALQMELKPVFFDYDSYALSPEAQSALQFNAEALRRVAHYGVVAEGHCDERGAAEYNLALGDRRARAAVDYLVSIGIPPNRFSVVSYGAELPADPSHNESAWSKNRRVYLRVAR